MTNFLVLPNLYNGYALTEVSNGLIRDIKENNLDVEIIGFEQEMVTLDSGRLDDPDIFFKHNMQSIEKLKSLVKDGDKILFVDMFQLGLGLLHYYFLGTNKKVKYGALIHGASFISRDFYENETWLELFERGMINLMEVIYTPAKYYADFFDEDIRSKKMKILPFGFYPDKFRCSLDAADKDIDVIIPHRFSWDKCPEFYYELAKSMPDIIFGLSGSKQNEKDEKLKELFDAFALLPNVKLLGINSGDKQHENMRRAKVVVAVRDSFGYAFREAMASGCIPVLKNATCYPEYIPGKYLFNTIEEAQNMIRKFVKDYPKDYLIPEKLTFKAILEDFYGKAN